MKLRILAAVLTFVILFAQPVYSSGASYEAMAEAIAEISNAAQASILYCCDNGEVVYSSDCDKRLPMASTTKIMTAVIVIENCDITKTVKVKGDACGVEGSSIYLYENEKITIKDLLYALMLESANDAATALAIEVGGNVDSFVSMMNEKAKELGMKNTSYRNPHGLDDDEHYSSARDLAVLMSYAMKNECFAEITGSYRYSSEMDGKSERRMFLNHNRLLNSCEGVCGGKTGFTKRSGRCLVSVAVRNGIMMCAVTLNDPDDWKDHKELYDEGFKLYEKYETNELRFEIPVINSENKSLSVMSEGVCLVIKAGESDSVQAIVEHDKFLYADIEKDEIVGRVVYRLENKIIGESEIKAIEHIPSIKYKGFWEKIISFFK